MSGTGLLATAEEAWGALVRRHLRRSGLRRRLTLVESGHRGGAPLWPLTQVLHAAVLLRAAGGAAAGADDLPALLRRHASGPAFSDVPGSARRYYDDNAWVALADEAGRRLLQRTLLGGVERDSLDDWLLGGRVDGGVRWREGNPALHAVSTGAVGLVLALRCDRQPQRVLHTAVGDAAGFLAGTLRGEDGLVRDRLLPGGGVEPTVWSYNQGLAVGLDVARHRLGNPGALARARSYADAGVRRFAGNAGWAQPLAFQAVWCRSLVALAAFDPDPRWRDHVLAHADRVAALPRIGDGDLAGHGAVPDPGRYEAGRSEALDLAGAVQALATAVLLTDHADTARLADVC